MEVRKVSISSMLLDIGNPRFDPVYDQASAVEGLLSICGDKIVKLATDIIKYGVNPTDVLICTEEKIESGKTVYIVKEGNRRLLAIKALRKPSIITNAKWKSKFARILHLYGGIENVPSRLDVRIFGADEIEQMNHWIAIKHDGENEGAGTVPWGPEEKSRFTGNGRNNMAVRVKAWLRSLPAISDEDKAKIDIVPITTFDRILSPAQARVALGISFRDGQLRATREIKNVMANLIEVVRDLTTPDPANHKRKIINVSDVKNTEQILAYLGKYDRDDDSLDQEILLTDGTESRTDSVVLGENADERNNTGHSRNSAPTAGSRRCLRIMLRKVLAVTTNPKLKKLINEMILMPVDKMPLSFCVSFRTILEVSMLTYARGNSITTGNNDGYRVKYKELASLCKGKILAGDGWKDSVSKKLINDAVTCLNNETMFSISELNNLVHDTSSVPSCDNILAYAPRVIHFLIALNGGLPDNVS